MTDDIPYMVIQVALTTDDILSLPTCPCPRFGGMRDMSQVLQEALIHLLRTKGLQIRSASDFDGTITQWEDFQTGQLIYRQTIPCAKEPR